MVYRYVGMVDRSCAITVCQNRAGIIVGNLIGGLVGFGVVMLGVSICYSRYKDEPRQNNSMFFILANQNINQQEGYDVSPFQSGIWSSRYFQHGTWHTVIKFLHLLILNQ